MQLENLPDVPLDKLLGYLEPEDLRRFHQVSKTWKNILECRPRLNTLRVDLVNKIRQNKENIPKGNVPLDSITPVSKRPESAPPPSTDGKPGGRKYLGAITNPRLTTVHSLNRSGLKTPTSRFLQEFEAGKKLVKGQQLFRCPECRSPVPSPVSTTGRGSRLARPVTKIVDVDAYLSENQDSGYQSINSISSDSQGTEDTSEENNNIYSDHEYSQEEICMSIIATPENYASTGKRNCATPKSYEGLIKRSEKSLTCSKFGYDLNSASTLGAGTPDGDASVAQCPSCNHRFCCGCQSSAHPGRTCYVIDSETLATPSSAATLPDAKTAKNRQKSGKSTLRRLARL